MPPTNLKPQPPPTHIARPETPDHKKWEDVWEKMNEGELLYARLAEKVGGMADAQNEIKTDVRELRKQMHDHEKLNEERAEAARVGLDALRTSTANGFKEVDLRLDAVVRVQAEQGAQLRQLVDAEVERDAERKAQGEMLRRIDTALTARAAVEADRAAVSQPGDSPPLPSLSPTHPNLPALPPRRVPLPAVVGGVGGVGMAVVAAVSNSPVLQWGVVVVAAILAFGWALRGRAPSA
mgnify:CR=1 FL=1